MARIWMDEKREVVKRWRTRGSGGAAPGFLTSSPPWVGTTRERFTLDPRIKSENRIRLIHMDGDGSRSRRVRVNFLSSKYLVSFFFVFALFSLFLLERKKGVRDACAKAGQEDLDLGAVGLYNRLVGSTPGHPWTSIL